MTISAADFMGVNHDAADLPGEKGKTMSDQLEEFLAPPAAPEEPEAPVETPAEPEKAEEAPTVTATEPEKAPDVDGLKAALLAERRKRQEYEQALARKQEEEKPYLGDAYEERFRETEQRFQNEIIRQKLDLSETFARDRHEDFDAKLDIFQQMVAANPALYQTMVQQVNPAEFAYKTASDQIRLKEMSDPDAYRAKIEAEVRQKVEAEYAEKLKKGQVPPTLADARGGAGARPAEWSGPAPLTDLLK